MSETNKNEPKISFHYQPNGESIGELITKHVKTAEKIWIASAFLTKHGLDLLKNAPNNCEIRIICGVSGSISDLPELEKWIKGNEKRRKGKVFSEPYMFHSKLYIFFRRGTKVSFLIGSGNFTKGGTELNEEIMLEYECDLTDPTVGETKKYFKNLWDNQKIRVGEYLINHKEYETKEAEFEKLSENQKEILKKIMQNKKERSKLNTVFFEKDMDEIKHTFFNKGQITIPNKYYDLIEGQNLFKDGNSKNWKANLSWSDKVFIGELLPDKKDSPQNYRVYFNNPIAIRLDQMFSSIKRISIEINFDEKRYYISKEK